MFIQREIMIIIKWLTRRTASTTQLVYERVYGLSAGGKQPAYSIADSDRPCKVSSAFVTKLRRLME
jgi:hypothetical protein